MKPKKGSQLECGQPYRFDLAYNSHKSIETIAVLFFISLYVLQPSLMEGIE